MANDELRRATRREKILGNAQDRLKRISNFKHDSGIVP